MVLAEIPLWITHGSGDTTGGSTTATTGGATKKASAASSSSGGGGANNAMDHAHAIASMGLWRKDRPAIYAIDVHSQKSICCTGGGDGTVRIWSTTPFFHSLHQGGRFATSNTNQNAVGAKIDTDKTNNKTGYVSTSSSSTGSDGGGGGSEGEERMSTDDASLGSGTSNNNKNTNTAPPAVIHDLNNVVRSRKHPEQHSPERLAAGNAATVPTETGGTTNPEAPPSSPAKHHQQRLLCTLSAHTGSSVLAVKFSSTGKLLASAGDDGCVCLYAPDDTDHPVAWHRILLCRGHNLDAVGLAWSPDDSYLVSVSLDRETPILVWKVADVAEALRAPPGSMIRQPYKVLGRTEHQSTVKGVCFDPVGSYIATSGDDPAVCLWRTHGDWGLECKIDASAGIFRQWGGTTVPLSSQSLFRRLSWSTDGAHVITTNATVKNKHVASTISREQWSTTGSANLVGHKQPIVVAQHAPVLLQVQNSNNDPSAGAATVGDDDEPEYATLLALGDKKGFVTIWSTRKSRPLFKLQCSEGRCTVTDMAWGVAEDHLLLTVALLDGHVVVLRLGIPDELGPLLSSADQAKLFRIRYGIDTNDPSSYGRLMDDTRPKLIETALQMTLEEENEEEEDNMQIDDHDATPPPAPAAVTQLMGRSKKDGKKRVQPLLMTTQKPLSPPATKRAKPSAKVPPVDALENAKQIAEKAAAAAKVTTIPNAATTAPAGAVLPPSPHRMPPPPTVLTTTSATATSLTHSTERVHSVELSVETGFLAEQEVRWTVECQNRSAQVPLGSKGPGLPCVDVSLQRDGKALWHDQIVGTSCCALAGNDKLFCVGTVDGTIQIYGASPSTGWRGETAIRAFPPIVLGQPIVTLQIRTWEGSACLLVVSADGLFGVYRLEPTMSKVFAGSILPAMMHMANATLHEEKNMPKLSRCQMTDKGQILLLLSASATQNSSVGLPTHAEQRSRPNLPDPNIGTTVGGSIQGFVYHREMGLWLRISDSRFVLSDFYSSLPIRQSGREQGSLRQLDDAVRLGAMESAVKPSQRKRQDSSTGVSMFTMANDSGNFVPTKAHCEDRLACSIALNSPSEFRQWLGMYAKTLAASGQEALLRMLMDVLIDSSADSGWWLCTGLSTMGLDRKELLKKVLLPAMSKNRALQRLTNELVMEIDS
eukprot:scaffold2760_cov167-Amphora_coffeaeformis.AAC.14